MGAKSKIAGFVRWVLTWPILVIIALNIENAVSEAGYSTIFNWRWAEDQPMLTGIYDVATSGWILYPILVLFGAILYEWVVYTSNRMEAPGSSYQKWLVCWLAETMSAAFLKRGISRRSIKPDRDITRFNNRLAQFDLPPVPVDFTGPEEHNREISSYLMLITKGQFDHARQFIMGINLETDSAPQSPEGIAAEKQP